MPVVKVGEHGPGCHLSTLLAEGSWLTASTSHGAILWDLRACTSEMATLLISNVYMQQIALLH
jgi:hypothetical protein